MIRTERRPGFALTAALWAIAAAGIVVAAAAANARDAVGAARNRSTLTQGQWLATGCVERALAWANDTLWPPVFTPQSVARTWNALDSSLEAHAFPDCAMTIRPAGLTTDVNALSGMELRRLLRRAGMPPARTDSLADALLDWLDEDEAARPSGAEASWYAAMHRALPRNGPMRSISELRLVRGFEDLPDVQSLLGTENDRIVWPRAASAVLASLPGMTDEAVSILESHGRGSVDNLTLLGEFPEMSAAARAAFAQAVPELAQRTVSTPEAWIIASTVTSGDPPLSVTVETRVRRGERRLYELGRVLRR